MFAFLFDSDGVQAEARFPAMPPKLTPRVHLPAGSARAWAARTAADTFVRSTLYRAAARARFESLPRGWRGPYPGQYRSETSAQTMKKCCTRESSISRTAFSAMLP